MFEYRPRCFNWCLGLFLYLFVPREKNMAFYEERSKKAIFKNKQALFGFDKYTRKEAHLSNARKSVSGKAHQRA